jgi:hypothetical protein
MPEQVRLAESTLGPLSAGRKYCLKIPSVLGGRYRRDNLATVPLSELIRFAGERRPAVRRLAALELA